MGRFNKNTKLEDIMSDKEGAKIIKRALPLATIHPRFREALSYTLEEILEDKMSEIVGIPNSKVEAVFQKLYELE